jgi:hypothetical protein
MFFRVGFAECLIILLLLVIVIVSIALAVRMGRR